MFLYWIELNIQEIEEMENEQGLLLKVNLIKSEEHYEYVKCG